MEKIKKYVERFLRAIKMNANYELKFGEMEQGVKEVCYATDADKALDIVITFFNFGYAKGYRAALSEIKKGGVS